MNQSRSLPPWTPRERTAAIIFAIAAAALALDAALLWPQSRGRAAPGLVAFGSAGALAAVVALYFDRRPGEVWQWLPGLIGLVMAGALPFFAGAGSTNRVLGYLGSLGLAFLAALLMFRARRKWRHPPSVRV